MFIPHGIKIYQRDIHLINFDIVLGPKLIGRIAFHCIYSFFVFYSITSFFTNLKS